MENCELPGSQKIEGLRSKNAVNKSILTGLLLVLKLVYVLCLKAHELKPMSRS